MLDGPRLGPADGGPARQLVVFLHGYGADGNDLIDIGRHWAPLLPGCAFVSPHAPEPCAEMPSGRQWFPLVLDDPRSHWQGLVHAAPDLHAFLDAERDKLGLRDSDIALVGFSQGTMMALHVGPRRAHSLAGIVGYSGHLAGAERLRDEAVSRPPILLIHGGADPLIPVVALHGAVPVLGAADFAVEWHVSPGLQHGIDGDGLERGGTFLKRVLAGR